jgi:two-component system sensor histidine kinase HydH
MPRGGLIELQTRCRDGMVELEIIDNGCGMDAQTLSRIFEVFWSKRLSGTPPGSGLGLATVKRIVEAHGGGITVASEPARGTRFTLSLPPVS